MDVRRCTPCLGCGSQSSKRRFVWGVSACRCRVSPIMLKMSTGENPDHDCVNSQLEKVVPRFSLVVPMFNESTRIAATIDELSKSRFLTAECEIVFVDDGSSDNSAELAGRLASES
ncbi:MAG: glycosyltransferase, partial [Actinobacteria bacterium]|nr:glycosyltransferase [Actinomycetota bacterium]